MSDDFYQRVDDLTTAKADSELKIAQLLPYATKWLELAESHFELDEVEQAVLKGIRRGDYS